MNTNYRSPNLLCTIPNKNCVAKRQWHAYKGSWHQHTMFYTCYRNHDVKCIRCPLKRESGWDSKPVCLHTVVAMIEISSYLGIERWLSRSNTVSRFTAVVTTSPAHGDRMSFLGAVTLFSTPLPPQSDTEIFWLEQNFYQSFQRGRETREWHIRVTGNMKFK